MVRDDCDLGELEPKTDNLGEYLESKQEYFQRFSKVFPKIPKGVVDQLFYAHPRSLYDYNWIGLESLRFSKDLWPTSKIPQSDFGNVPAVETYRLNIFRKGNKSRIRLVNYFEEHGTWPVPVVFVLNPKDDVVRGDGWRLGSPVHLLEGHNRMACFLEYFERQQLGPFHKVFVGVYDV